MQVKKLNGKSNVIGKNIKKYRELRNLTQRELSNKLSLLVNLIVGILFIAIMLAIGGAVIACGCAMSSGS